MHGKHILMMACSACLLAAAGTALAADNATNSTQQSNSYETDTSTSPTTSSQSDWGADNTTDNMTSTTQSSQNDAMTEAAASGTGSAGNMGMDDNAKPEPGQDYHVVGKLVDDSGQVRGYVLRIGGTDANGMVRYIITPQTQLGTASNSSSETAHITHTAETEANNSTTGQRKNLLQRMYQQLQVQAFQIRMLKNELVQQRPVAQNGMMGWKHDQAGNSSQQGPLDQVAHIVVDQRGQVQAVVLDSGVILTSNNWRNIARALSDDSSGDMATGAAAHMSSAGQSGQRRRAMVIFKPTQ